VNVNVDLPLDLNTQDETGCRGPSSMSPWPVAHRPGRLDRRRRRAGKP